MRTMPWNVKGVADTNSLKSDKFMAYRCYGSGLKTTAKFTADITATLFAGANDANQKGGAGTFDFAGTFANADLDNTDSATGYLVFKMAKETWGGSCCTDHDGCTSNKCDIADGANLKPLSLGHEYRISHGYYSATSSAYGDGESGVGIKQHNALMSVKFAGAMTFSETTMTALRGKGGFGTTQNLNDVFFQM